MRTGCVMIGKGRLFNVYSILVNPQCERTSSLVGSSWAQNVFGRIKISAWHSVAMEAVFFFLSVVFMSLQRLMSKVMFLYK